MYGHKVSGHKKVTKKNIQMIILTIKSPTNPETKDIQVSSILKKYNPFFCIYLSLQNMLIYCAMSQKKFTILKKYGFKNI